MFELKRQSKIGTETVLKGTQDHSINWLLDVIHNNKYEYTTTVNLVMQPVWIINQGDKVFWLELSKH